MPSLSSSQRPARTRYPWELGGNRPTGEPEHVERYRVHPVGPARRHVLSGDQPGCRCGYGRSGLASVEAVTAFLGDGAQGLGEPGSVEAITRSGSGPGWVEPGGCWLIPQPRFETAERSRQLVGCLEAILGERNGPSEEAVEWDRAEAVTQSHPTVHASRDRCRRRVVPWDLGMAIASHRLGVNARPGAARCVECRRHTVPGPVHQGEEVAADPACLGSDHSEHGIGSDGGVDPVAPSFENFDRGCGRQVVGCHYGVARPGNLGRHSLLGSGSRHRLAADPASVRAPCLNHRTG